MVQINSKQTNFTVTTHDEICSPGYEPSGKCPRAILTGLATLITKKVVTATFVAPAATLIKFYLLSISNVLKLVRSVKPSYNVAMDIDVKEASFVTSIQYAIIFGPITPLLLPLLCMQHATDLAVFHIVTSRLRVQTSNEAKCSSRYLFVGLVYGIGMVIWLYAENDWHGKYVVFTALPLSSLVTCIYALWGSGHSVLESEVRGIIIQLSMHRPT